MVREEYCIHRFFPRDHINFSDRQRMISLSAGSDDAIKPDQHLTQSNDFRQGYLDAVAEFRSKLGGICQRNHIEHVEVDTSCGIAEVLIGYLNYRSPLNRDR
ncbi:MAG: hypothetical protein ACI8P0_004247 [Planctomycetaceae bacterium]|jgi:hypothetical protein